MHSYHIQHDILWGTRRVNKKKGHDTAEADLAHMYFLRTRRRKHGSNHPVYVLFVLNYITGAWVGGSVARVMARCAGRGGRTYVARRMS